MDDTSEHLRSLLGAALTLVRDLEMTPENRATEVALVEAVRWQAAARAIRAGAGGEHPVALAWEEV